MAFMGLSLFNIVGFNGFNSPFADDKPMTHHLFRLSIVYVFFVHINHESSRVLNYISPLSYTGSEFN